MANTIVVSNRNQNRIYSLEAVLRSIYLKISLILNKS